MSDNYIQLLQERPGVATLLINRAAQHNAFNDTMITAMIEACDEVANSRDLRVLVLSSRGRNFSAGADLAWMQRMADYSHEQNLDDARALAKLMQSLDSLPQVTIARVQGAAFGGAVGLISCCDLAVASTQSRFSLSEVKLGLIPATISPYVIAAIGARAARRYFLTGEAFDAATACRLGLISEQVGEDALERQVEHWIDTVLDNGPQALKAAKQLVSDVDGAVVNDALIEDTCRRIADIRVSAEGQAGLRAFLDKQPAPWREN